MKSLTRTIARRSSAGGRRLLEGLRYGTLGDLYEVIAFAVAAWILVMADGASTVVRAAAGFPLLFLAPGYVTAAALFPRAEGARADGADDRTLVRQVRRITAVERAALSFGLSMALLPLLGLAIAASTRGFERPVVVSAVSCFVVVGAVAAAWRRLQVPPRDRYRTSLRSALGTARAAVLDTDPPRHAAVNALLAASLLVAATTVGYALVAPQQGERYTDLSLLTETEAGERVAADHPDELAVGESHPLVARIANHEGEQTEYELVVVVERVEPTDGGVTVVEQEEVTRAAETVDAGETWYYDHDVTTELTGEDLRVSYLLYEDEAPTAPSAQTAYRHTYFWIDVEPPA